MSSAKIFLSLLVLVLAVSASVATRPAANDATVDAVAAISRSARTLLQECQSTTFKYYKKCSWDGDDYGAKKVSNLTACRKYCENDDDCWSFDFDKKTKTCYLYEDNEDDMGYSADANFDCGALQCAD